MIRRTSSNSKVTIDSVSRNSLDFSFMALRFITLSSDRENSDWIRNDGFMGPIQLWVNFQLSILSLQRLSILSSSIRDCAAMEEILVWP